MISIILTIVLSIIFSANIAEANIRVKRLLNGNLVKERMYMYQVSLQQSESNICGAGIMNDLFLITAAHCVTNERGEFLHEQLTAVIGSIDLKKPDRHTIKRKVSKYFIPKEYNPSDASPIADIALLKLEGPIGLKKNENFTTKLELPVEPYVPYAGSLAIIAGFGCDRNIKVIRDPVTGLYTEMGESSGLMRYLHEQVIANEECGKVMKNAVLPEHLCARAKRQSLVPQGVCNGDSGSPLVVNGNTIIGVLAQGPTGCKEIRGAGRYTRVTSYIPFITNALYEVNNRHMSQAEWITSAGGNQKFLHVTEADA